MVFLGFISKNTKFKTASKSANQKSEDDLIKEKRNNKIAVKFEPKNPFLNYTSKHNQSLK